MKTKIAVLLVLLPFCSIGQEEVQLRKEISEKVIAARKESESLLPKYSWISRTEVLKGKELLNMVIEKNMFGTDGRIISTTLNEQGAKMPTAFLIRDIAEEEKTNIQKFLY